MPVITTKQFIGALPDQCNLQILAGSLTYKIHRYDRRSGNRFLQPGDNSRQGFLESPPVNLNGYVVRGQDLRGFCSIDQFIILETFPVADSICLPVVTTIIH